MRTALSKRTEQIAERERELALAGYNLDAKGHELAGRTSRDAKPEGGLDERAWLEQVRAEMAEHGLDEEAVEALMELADAPAIEPVDEQLLAIGCSVLRG